MTTIVSSRLYRMRDDLPHDESVAARCAGIEPGATYWLVRSYPSSIGGYIGHLEGTYEHSLGVSPNGKTVCRNLPMRYMENFGLAVCGSDE